MSRDVRRAMRIVGLLDAGCGMRDAGCGTLSSNWGGKEVLALGVALGGKATRFLALKAGFNVGCNWRDLIISVPANYGT